MLPILPALLFLLLHGPSNVERLAQEGRLPAGLEGMRRETAQVAATPDRRSQAAMVAMLSSHDPCLTQALIELFRPDEPEPVAPPVAQTIRPATPIEPLVRSIADGFSECRRSRDGPGVIA
jgi:hypothetical protein